jgi:hypothetical protein
VGRDKSRVFFCILISAWVGGAASRSVRALDELPEPCYVVFDECYRRGMTPPQVTLDERHS